jgi:hypothetical protein
MRWDIPPSLLETLNRLGGGAQEPGQLALTLSQIAADLREFFFPHSAISFLHSHNHTTKWLV